MKYIVLMFSSTVIGVLALLGMIAVSGDFAALITASANNVHEQLIPFGFVALAAIFGIIIPLGDIISTERSLTRDIREVRALNGVLRDRCDKYQQDLAECEETVQKYRLELIKRVEKALSVEQLRLSRNQIEEPE